MFIQPDWWEVTQAGVGTNRHAYAGGDPVNGIDPTGNAENPLDWMLNILGPAMESVVPEASSRSFLVDTAWSTAKTILPSVQSTIDASAAWERGDYLAYAGHEVMAMLEIAATVATAGEYAIARAATRGMAGEVKVVARSPEIGGGAKEAKKLMFGPHTNIELEKIFGWGKSRKGIDRAIATLDDERMAIIKNSKTLESVEAARDFYSQANEAGAGISRNPEVGAVSLMRSTYMQMIIDRW